MTARCSCTRARAAARRACSSSASCGRCCDDGVGVERILAITFTEKAAAELKGRLRRRFLDLGEREQAREAEAAWVSTIHGFCSRVLRANALLGGHRPRVPRARRGRRRAALDRRVRPRARGVRAARALGRRRAARPGCLLHARQAAADGHDGVLAAAQSRGSARRRCRRSTRRSCGDERARLDACARGRAARARAAGAAEQDGAGGDRADRGLHGGAAARCRRARSATPSTSRRSA